MRTLEAAIIITLGLLIGLVVGDGLGQPETGAIIGAFIALPVSLFAYTQRLRWLVVIFINAWFAICYLEGGWWALISAVTACLLTFLLSTVLLRHLYPGGFPEAFNHHLRLALGLTGGFHIIEEGRTITPQRQGPVFGPMMVLVKPENAIVMEAGSRRTQVRGPSFFPSAPFEHVKHILDLRQQCHTLTFTDVLTVDMLPTTVRLSVGYCIDVSDRTRQGQSPNSALPPDEEERLRLLALNLPNWDEAARIAIEASIRGFFAAQPLTTILGLNATSRLEESLLTVTRNRCQQIRIRVDTLLLESIIPDPGLASAASDVWIADRKAEITSIAEIARAAAIRDALRLIAEGYAVAKARGMTEPDIHREVLRRTLEKIAKDPATKIILPPELQTLIN